MITYWSPSSLTATSLNLISDPAPSFLLPQHLTNIPQGLIDQLQGHSGRVVGGILWYGLSVGMIAVDHLLDVSRDKEQGITAWRSSTFPYPHFIIPLFRFVDTFLDTLSHSESRRLFSSNNLEEGGKKTKQYCIKNAVPPHVELAIR